MAHSSLGRGLDALLSRKKMGMPNADNGTGISDEQIVTLPISSIVTNDFQPRHEFNEEQIFELANSIREYGIIQPLVVSREGDHYRLIAGERRLRAAKMIGLERVPVVMRDAGDHERLAVALIENVQRVDLNPIELGWAYKRLADEFSLSHEEIGKRVGKSRPAVSNMIRLLNLPALIQDALREGKIHMATARALLGMTDPDKQLEFFYTILEGKGTTTNETEKQVGRMRGAPAGKRRGMDRTLLAKEEALRERFGTKVVVESKSDGGRVIIHFYSPEELEELYSHLMS